jgi:acyl carrier protein
MKNIKDKLKKIISKNINVDIADLKSTSKINDFKSFDSLAAVKIILQANKELNLKLEFSDFEQSKKIEYILNNINKKTK